MWQTVLNTIITAAVAAGVSVFVAAIKTVGDAGIQFFKEKAAAVKAQAGADKWNNWMTLARQGWNIVDENFRITPAIEKTFAAKQAAFAVEIKKLIPEITDDQIEQLRQAVAGEVNKGKAAVTGQTQDEQGNGLAADDKAAATAAQAAAGTAPVVNAAAASAADSSAAASTGTNASAPATPTQA